MTKEELYDKEIAPKLAEIANKCGELGLSFVATVEYAPYSIARTKLLVPGSTIAIETVDWAAQSAGNADKLIMAMMRHATKSGHQSACLRILGVPEGPVNPNTPQPSAAITIAG